MRAFRSIWRHLAVPAALGALVCASSACRSDESRAVENVQREPAVASAHESEDAGTRANAPEPEYTPEERARFRRHLHLGRAHAEERRYADAMREFQAALDTIANEPRALSELGWAAFLSGDYERARVANQDALRLARDPKVRAASLYNLGRLAEATGDIAEAEEHYRASLELRENPTVARRLDGLRAARPAPEPTRSAACVALATEDELCQCVLASRAMRASGACQREPRGMPDVELLFAGRDTDEWVYLVHHGEPGWSAIATLGQVRDDARREIHRELEIARFEMRTIGGREVLWVETEDTRTEAKGPTRKIHSLFLCPRTSDASTFECKLEIPTTEDLARAASNRAEATRRLDVDVRDDGLVTVILASGPRDEAVAPLLGEHQLF